MSKFFILDMGSGNTCQNNEKIIDQMLEALEDIDKYRHCILKFQLFEKAGDNIPLHHSIFNYAYRHATVKGWQVTASVFDIKSLIFLHEYNIPFIKIANRPDLYWLAGEVPRKIPVLASIGNNQDPYPDLIFAEKLHCISRYPALIEDYEAVYTQGELKRAVSDHTSTWELYEKYNPTFYECHFCLDTSTGLDAGVFARRPNDLKYISPFWEV